MKKKIAMRHAKPEDTNIIFEFIKELAEYEKLLHEVTTTEEQLKNFEEEYPEVVSEYYFKHRP